MARFKWEKHHTHLGYGRTGGSCLSVESVMLFVNPWQRISLHLEGINFLASYCPQFCFKLCFTPPASQKLCLSLRLSIAVQTGCVADGFLLPCVLLRLNTAGCFSSVACHPAALCIRWQNDGETQKLRQRPTNRTPVSSIHKNTYWCRHSPVKWLCYYLRFLRYHALIQIASRCECMFENSVDICSTRNLSWIHIPLTRKWELVPLWIDATLHIALTAAMWQ